MNDPVLYSKHNKLPQHDVKELLEKYASKMRWNIYGSRILDIGCADGGITTKILTTFLPKNYQKLVGSDISEEMVKYANKHYEDQRTYFVKHDIQSNVPEEMRESFDHVFSFYTLHWIQKQRKAISNIYNMVTKNGDCLLMLIGYSSIFAVYRLLAKNPKWRQWLTDAEQYISPYQDSLIPDKEFRLLMEDVGFRNIDVTCQHKSFLYTGPHCIDDVKGLVAAVSPFKIPKELLDDYLKDYLQTAIEHKLMKCTKDGCGGVGISYSYSLIVAYGSK